MSARPDLLDSLQYSRELCEQVNAEADNATWWWFPYAGALVLVLAIAASALWPWGFAA